MIYSSIDAKEKLLRFVKSMGHSYSKTLSDEYNMVKGTYTNYERTELTNALKRYILDLQALCKTIEDTHE